MKHVNYPHTTNHIKPQDSLGLSVVPFVKPTAIKKTAAKKTAAKKTNKCLAKSALYTAVSSIMMMSLNSSVMAQTIDTGSTADVDNSLILPALNANVNANVNANNSSHYRADKSDTTYKNDVQNNNDVQSNLAQPNLADISDQEQLEQALDALHLKRAVEQGIIDASVLEQYQQETLNKHKQKPSKTQSSTVAQSANANANINANTSIDTSVDTGSKQANTTAPNSPATGVLPVATDEQDNLTINDELAKQAQSIGQQGYQMMSADEIDRQLAKVDVMVKQAATFDKPVATLNSTATPIGLDAELNDIEIKIPSNTQTLGLAQDVPQEPAIPKAPTINAPKTDAVDRPVEVSDAVSSSALNATDTKTDTNTLGDDLTEQNNPNQVLNQYAQNGVSNKITGDNQQQVLQGYVESDKALDPDKELNPDDYLPDYQPASDSEAVANSVEGSAEKKPRARNEGNIFKRLYNRYFNDGYAALPRIEATVYFEQTQAGQNTLVKADDEVQPINNIKAALEDITAESVADFAAALPRLRQTALEAAKAVGYYEVALRLRQRDNEQIDVIIESLGEPVRVKNRVFEVRGAGGNEDKYQVLAATLPPQKGDIFNHGAYKASKAAVESLSLEEGYFDQYWLNKSVDVILPDNTADVDLIYNTGERYQFGDVIFFTYDKATNQLTTDPDKLPVKPELLRQLLGFKQGDSYYRPKITEFTNDLSATRYFNNVNVETILPAGSINDTGTLGFAQENQANQKEQSQTTDADVTTATASSTNNDETTSNDEGEVITLDKQNQIKEVAISKVANSTSNNESNISNDSQDRQVIAEEDIAPIDFEVDQVTADKLLAIRQKAERLISLPDNRVLDEKDEKAKNLLGKISDSISNIAQKILPDPKEEISRPAPEDLIARKTPQQVQADKKIPLYVFVVAENPRDAQVGIGYGTDTGMRATAKLDYNLINREGYQAGFEVEASGIGKKAKVYASRPWNHPLDDTLDASLSYTQEELNQGDNRIDATTDSLQASLARNIKRENGWDKTYSVRYRLDQINIEENASKREDLPTEFRASRLNQEALLLGYGMSKLSVDNVTNPTRGVRQYYGVEAGVDGALTSTNMAILRAGLRGIYTFGDDKKHQVLGRFDGGYLWADNFRDVPYNERFFAGGDQSIRGFDYKSLSPLQNDYLIGGEVLAVASAEYNYEFIPGLRGALFTDFGNAYDKDFNADTNVGVGVGVRWASPIGLVRLDVAAGVTDDGTPIRLHFFIGSPL